jgi:hypothetical protein
LINANSRQARPQKTVEKTLRPVMRAELHAAGKLEKASRELAK